MRVVKTAFDGTGRFGAVGGTGNYTFAVINDGNVTLNSPIRVADDKVRVTCPAMPGAGLPPLGTLTCAATYRVTQADLDAGSVTNIAAASISLAVVPSATYPGGVAAVISSTDTVTVDAAQLPALSITKQIKPATSPT